MEEWKDIVGYEGHYQISSDGRLRSMERKVKHKTLFNGQTKHSLKGSCRWVYIERGMSDTLHGTLLRAKLSI